jgi:MOSC domain-containing protein
MPDRHRSVSELWRYPVKSFRGEQLEEIRLDGRGVVGDRVFAVRDANGKFGSGKTTRRFRLLRDLFDFSAETDGEGVVVCTPGGACLRVGDPALDALLSARYGERLAVLPEATVSHFDAGPVHVLTTSSLGWVQAGYGSTGGDARRYRPNIVLDTGEDEALVEETWLGASLSVGSCLLRVSGTVERCVMPTFSQDGLPRAPELLRFLVERNQTMLGVYATIVSPGTIRVGDTVTVERC